MASLVPALVTLRSQINARWPNRSKASDGWIGDPAHAARQSYHNPDKNGWVHALDITHDPDGGVNINTFTDELAASGDSRILELIANALYWHHSNKRWVKYNGSNPHRAHFHISAKPGTTAMNGSNWNLPSLRGVVAQPHPQPQPNIPNNADFTKKLQGFLNRYYRLNLAVDGVYGPKTTEAVKRFQRNYGHGLAVDGIAGPATRKAMGI
jgi:hypothetical protein